MEKLVLYVLPLVPRLATPPDDWWRAVISLLPLAVVAPSLYLPLIFKDERWEHVVRHAVYALAFTVSMASSVRWEEEAIPAPLVAYLAVGSLTLWWFCLSHVIENAGYRLYTHHGDVAVLPLTLVAIGTFAYDVPDAVFQWSRSIVFYVPVTVAWATLLFVAHQGFAETATTTHSDPGFSFRAHSGLVVSSAHLMLLETRASPLFFQFLPVVAALLFQVTPLEQRDPARTPLSAVVSGLACGAALSALLHPLLDTPGIYVAAPVACAAARLCVAPLTRRWVVPSALYATLLTFAALPLQEDDVGRTVVEVSALASGYAVAMQLTAWLSPSERLPRPTTSAPPSFFPAECVSTSLPASSDVWRVEGSDAGLEYLVGRRRKVWHTWSRQAVSALSWSWEEEDGAGWIRVETSLLGLFARRTAWDRSRGEDLKERVDETGRVVWRAKRLLRPDGTRTAYYVTGGSRWRSAISGRGCA